MVAVMTVTCFLLKEAGLARIGLRRYTPFLDTCPRLGTTRMTYHDWTVYLGDVPRAPFQIINDQERKYPLAVYDYPDHDDPRWPASCPCGYQFGPDDTWQGWQEPLYHRTDTGELTTIREAPDGAMWNAWWMPYTKGPDGLCLVVKCPGGHEWMIDGRASNCTLPDDDEHHCWIRHGEPPRITVDKNGVTCNAGAGSIQAGTYHGFLIDGVFT